jgi:hypothetical protein
MLYTHGVGGSSPSPPTIKLQSSNMPELTRRRSPDHREEWWEIYYGDIHAGTISMRTGNPHDTEPWEWQCGFYPGSRPGECTSGMAETFDQARR